MTQRRARTPRGPLVLTVDDAPEINWILGRIMVRQGFQVHHAGCGQEALALGGDYGYQGIFVDAKLPDIAGLVLIEQLRALQRQPFVVLISGYFFRDDPLVEQALGAGLIQAFVAKPFMHDEIRALLARIAEAA